MARCYHIGLSYGFLITTERNSYPLEVQRVGKTPFLEYLQVLIKSSPSPSFAGYDSNSSPAGFESESTIQVFVVDFDS